MKKIINSLPLVALVLIVCQLVISTELAATGMNVKNIDQKISDLSDENQVLEVKVASISSLAKIYDQAKASGFVKATTNTVNITKEQFPVAYIAPQY